MKLAFSEAMREADRVAIEDCGVPSTLLMENAATGAAGAAMNLFGKNKTAAVFCGAGNNGGDGIAIARILKSRGIEVRCFLVGKPEQMTEDAREMTRRFEEIGGTLELFKNDGGQEEYCRCCGVLVDAIFGIGLSRELKGDALTAVRLINSCQGKVLAVDIASGVQADTGKIMGEAVRADVTVTFPMAKPGHLLMPGGICCGKLQVVDIGIPGAVLDGCFVSVYGMEEEMVRKSVPKRLRDAHKGQFGKLLLLCGSVGYTGAAAMAARSALRSGAGLVFLGTPKSVYEILAVKNDEAMVFPLPDDGVGRLSYSAWPMIEKRLMESTACLIGPGLGRSEEITELVCKVVEEARQPLVIDADGINAVAENIDVLKRTKCPVVLTPHDGEFGRLGGDLSGCDRLTAARDFSRRYGCILVLKGHRTITALPDGRAYVNTTGNPGMATGGSGDVLAGIITSLIGQGIPPEEAAAAAVWIHGKAGDLCADDLGEAGMLPTDMIDRLPCVLKQFE